MGLLTFLLLLGTGGGVFILATRILKPEFYQRIETNDSDTTTILAIGSLAVGIVLNILVYNLFPEEMHIWIAGGGFLATILLVGILERVDRRQEDSSQL